MGWSYDEDVMRDAADALTRLAAERDAARAEAEGLRELLRVARFNLSPLPWGDVKALCDRIDAALARAKAQSNDDYDHSFGRLSQE